MDSGWDPGLELREARWWHADGEKLVCGLCPRGCRLGKGQAGVCHVRHAHDGRLYSSSYGRPTGFGVDPIEKKPLSHFLPGSGILSFGTAGCNLTCRFCQNWQMSRARRGIGGTEIIPPEEVIRTAVERGCPSIAYTYNDPIVFAEYVIEVARLARKQGLNNVLVTNGYINGEPRGSLYRYIDAANVDLKALSNEFYEEWSGGSLEPVLETLRYIVRETDVWLEITNLLIPGLNDAEEQIHGLASWIVDELGRDVPLHLSAFHPDHEVTDRPRTPAATLTKAREVAMAAGVRYVYTGNVHDPAGQTTFCPGCDLAVVRRSWHTAQECLVQGGRCPKCGEPIAGVWDELPR